MINNVVLMGRLTADPELKNTATGVEVCSFCIAVDRKYQSKDSEKQTDFINMVAWRQTAAFITKYFRKGQMIAIEGSIQTRSYEDKEGKKRTVFEVLADNVSFCGSKSESSADKSVSYAEVAAQANIDVDANEDDLPF